MVDEDLIVSKPRTIKLVIEDDGKTNFRFYAEGDIERIGKISSNKYTAAEFWAVTFYAICQEQLDRNGEIKKIAVGTEKGNA